MNFYHTILPSIMCSTRSLSMAFAYKGNGGNDEEGYVRLYTSSEVSAFELHIEFNGTYLNEDNDTHHNKWYHAAAFYKNNQINCCNDQSGALVIPNFNAVLTSLVFAGVGDVANPTRLKNL